VAREVDLHFDVAMTAASAQSEGQEEFRRIVINRRRLSFTFPSSIDGNQQMDLSKLSVTPEQERFFHEIRVDSNPGMKAICESVLHDMAILDSKSAALLTFISVVIAGLIFSLGLVDAQAPFVHFIRGGIFGFMALFAFAAWIDLRCLYTLGPSQFPSDAKGDDFERISLLELSRRRNKYMLALYISETGFLLILPFALVWGLLAFRQMLS
jgi:hypothetical protein